MCRTDGHEEPITMADLAAMKAVFPEALLTLKDADPELAAIIEDEKERQW